MFFSRRNSRLGEEGWGQPLFGVEGTEPMAGL